MRKLLLEHKRAPGDVLVMSALVRDIALTYPSQFSISVHTSAASIWQNNPHVTHVNDHQQQQDIEHFKLGYGDAINLVGTRNRHFLLGFYEDFERQTGISVPLLYPRPAYYLSEEERTVPLVSGRYWVLVAGGKSDFVTKHWLYKRWQQLVNILRGFELRFVQVGAVGGNKDIYHYHPILENVLSLVGQTTLRDLARLIYHADGVICPITAAMHFAAALQKPCVVLGGGREEWWWEAYVPGLGNFGTDLREDVQVPHRYLHTLGKLDCCQRRGCWRNKVVGPTSVCKYPLPTTGQIVPLCMDMITVNHVVEAVMAYYSDGIIPPIGIPRRIAFVDGQPRLLSEYDAWPLETSALAAALHYPEPKLLVDTDGIRQIQNNSSTQ